MNDVTQIWTFANPRRLATLLEGAGLAFDILKVLKIPKINYGCFKAVKLVKKSV